MSGNQAMGLPAEPDVPEAGPSLLHQGVFGQINVIVRSTPARYAREIDEQGERQENARAKSGPLPQGISGIGHHQGFDGRGRHFLPDSLSARGRACKARADVSAAGVSGQVFLAKEGEGCLSSRRMKANTTSDPRRSYSDIGIVIPTYKEAENIGKLVLEVPRILPGATVAVVDDSPDGETERAVKALGLEAVSFVARRKKGGRGLSGFGRDGAAGRQRVPANRGYGCRFFSSSGGVAGALEGSGGARIGFADRQPLFAGEPNSELVSRAAGPLENSQHSLEAAAQVPGHGLHECLSSLFAQSLFGGRAKLRQAQQGIHYAERKPGEFLFARLESRGTPDDLD